MKEQFIKKLVSVLLVGIFILGGAISVHADSTSGMVSGCLKLTKTGIVRSVKACHKSNNQKSAIVFNSTIFDKDVARVTFIDGGGTLMTEVIDFSGKEMSKSATYTSKATAKKDMFITGRLLILSPSSFRYFNYTIKS